MCKWIRQVDKGNYADWNELKKSETPQALRYAGSIIAK